MEINIFAAWGLAFFFLCLGVYGGIQIGSAQERELAQRKILEQKNRELSEVNARVRALKARYQGVE